MEARVIAVSRHACLHGAARGYRLMEVPSIPRYNADRARKPFDDRLVIFGLASRSRAGARRLM